MKIKLPNIQLKRITNGTFVFLSYFISINVQRQNWLQRYTCLRRIANKDPIFKPHRLSKITVTCSYRRNVWSWLQIRYKWVKLRRQKSKKISSINLWQSKRFKVGIVLGRNLLFFLQLPDFSLHCKFIIFIIFNLQIHNLLWQSFLD